MRRTYHSPPAVPHRATPPSQEQSKTQLRNDAQMPPLFRQGYQIQCKRKWYATVVQSLLRRQMKLLETQEKKGKTICERYRETPGIQNMTAINEWVTLG